MTLKYFVPIIAGIVASPLLGADYYLDNVNGKDTNSGAKDSPMATYRALESKLQPGDTVYLNATGKIYRQEFALNKRGGKPDKPITIDGNGQTVSGADVIPANAWKQLPNGSYKADNVPAKVALIIDGQLVLEQMNRDSLKVGEWCWLQQFKYLYYMPAKGQKLGDCEFIVSMVDGSQQTLDPKLFHQSHSKIGAKRYPGLKEVVKLTVNGKEAKRGWAKDCLKPGAWNRTENDVYYMPASGKEPAKQTIETMVRCNGFGLAGSASYVTITNVNVEHVYNDGFNIHGQLKGVVFDRCNASQCGDEGVSAHGTCEITFTNSVIRECDNGMNHVGDSKSITKNVYIADCRNNGIEFQAGKKGVHSVEDAVIVNNRVQLTWRGAETSSVSLKNVLGVTTTSGKALVMLSGATSTIENMTLIAPSMRFNSQGNCPLTLKNAVFCVPKMEFDYRKRPLDFLVMENVIIPADTMLHNAYRNKESFLKTDQPGLQELTMPAPFSVSNAIKTLRGGNTGASASLYKIYDQNNRTKQ